MSIFYKPPDAVAADFIPFFWEGRCHLFYLKDYRDRDKHGEGTPWFHLVTDDFVAFEDWGEALPRGGDGDQDLYVFTGSAIARANEFHIFYTGHNPHFARVGRENEAVMHAVSSDLRTWRKDPGFRLTAPAQEGYEPHDWRDPFVFWNAEAGEYWMLLAARKGTGPARQRGLTALMASPDLARWELREPFWAPDLYYTHECPDLFRCGDWWYLVYSTFSERHITHYRMSRDLRGPWLAPADDGFDGRPVYAAKTASDGNRRLLFGWLATRTGEKDDGGWNWGGNLVVHELSQESDGTLTTHPVASILEQFGEALPLEPRPVLGAWRVDGATITGGEVGRGASLLLADLPPCCLVEAECSFAAGTTNAGLLLRADDALDRYYMLRIEPDRQRIVFDRWPRPGDQAFMIERPLPMAPETPVRFLVLIDDTCIVAYVNNRIALSCRMHDHRAGKLGLFVNEGKAHFNRVAIRPRKRTD